ncbi:LPXTG-motif cell wall anchor domain-containing protein [Micromonospora citrea]|uniref:LPXTG-motif cell wall anchor domain-containing protein n=1 Tax=Micromonospora citrea TaxID=47855 RepID=A0A1C6UAV5_9ACTN|nr:LPXTG cell wall anchor domain-containing protein [Micromonospora citrea]SCL51108.1 LPXTG-motif cell wall anchor domain-containing protein [Micromonospora citrea]
MTTHPLRAGAAVAVALLALPALAPAASAHAPTPNPTTAPPAGTPTVIARADHVFLKGDPWHPSAPLEAAVINQGTSAARGSFVLRLPAGVGLASGEDCRADAAAARTWVCGGAEVPAGGRRTYRLRLTATAAEPVFGVQAWGSVAGRDAAGVTDRPTDFRIDWPDRTSLRLRATATPIVDGKVTLTARVTNTGAFSIGGYALNVVTPDGVRVTGPACSDSGRMDGAGCEIPRPDVLGEDATDTVRVRLAVSGDAPTVRLFLAPTNRYTNEDTSVTLRLTADGGSTASPSADPNRTATPTPSAAGGTELPRTGPAGAAYALVGAALLALGAGLLLLRRRLVRG